MDADRLGCCFYLECQSLAQWMYVTVPDVSSQIGKPFTGHYEKVSCQWHEICPGMGNWNLILTTHTLSEIANNNFIYLQLHYTIISMCTIVSSHKFFPMTLSGYLSLFCPSSDTMYRLVGRRNSESIRCKLRQRYLISPFLELLVAFDL